MDEMQNNILTKKLTSENMNILFPANRGDLFFDALLGDASEGAFDIRFVFKKTRGHELILEFHLEQRPGKCLACSLTYGLPEVFSHHPVIDLNGLVRNINKLIEGYGECYDWKLGHTKEISHDRHVIPVTLFWKEQI